MTTYLAYLGAAVLINTIHVAITGHQFMICVSGCN